MISLTKKVEFALIILKHLEEKNLNNKDSQIVVKAHEIARVHKISEDFVAKVMQKLGKKQILISKQGAHGGYYLNEDLSKISLLQLLEVLEGHYTIVNCINVDKSCNYDYGCSIIDPMRLLNNKFREIYKGISLSEILTPYHLDNNNNHHGVKAKTTSQKNLQPQKTSATDKQSKGSIIGLIGSILSPVKNFVQVRRLKVSALVFFLAFFVLSEVNAKEVNVYSYRQQFLIEGILDKFTKTTGIKVNTIYIKKGLAERIKLEGKQSPADVILTTDIGQLIELKNNDIVKKVRSKKIRSAIPSNLRNKEGTWFALTTRARIIYASKDRIKEGDIKDYADLANPKWKKKICIRSGYHPYNLALFSSIIAHEGKTATEKFLKNLKRNLARKPQGNDRAQVKAIKEGLCDLSIGNSYYYAKMLYNHDQPEQIKWAKSVNLIFPNQDNRGTHYNVSGMALAKYAPNKSSAIKLMEFLVSDIAQYIYSSENYEYPVKKGIPLSSFLKTYMSDKKWDDLSLDKVVAERRKTIQILDSIQFDQ